MWKHVSSKTLQFQVLQSLCGNYDYFRMLSSAVLCTQHVCSICQQYHNRHFTTSKVLPKKKKSRLVKILQKDLPHKLKLKEAYNVRQKPKQPKLHLGPVIIRAGVTVQEVADAVGKSVDEVFEAMMYIENYNTDQYDSPSAVIDDINVVRELVKRCRHMYPTRVAAKHKENEDRDAHRRPPPDPEVLTKRPPVVTIMGHVDHGKTTLLDALRKSNIVEKEFGGITQHIGAFSVQLPDKNEIITFLDTPGHAAFSSMRARGAHATDIVILVVAADDGVMEQTIESIKYARNAEVAVLVAINKTDKPEADIERTKRELLAQGVELEDYGGDVQSVAISALKGTGLAELQEAVLTQAEIMDLKGDNSGLAEGIVIESSTDQARGGKLATILVQRGTLKRGNILVAGTSMAKVRLLLDDTGTPISSAPPSTPVEVTGWRDLPHPGDEVLQTESEARAKEVIKYRQDKVMEVKMEKDAVVIGQKVQEHQRWYQAELEKKRAIGRRKRFRDPRREKESVERTKPHLGIIIRGDVDGSVEAVLDVLSTYKSDKCDLDIMNFGVGPVTETDLELAQTFDGVIYAFNVPMPEDIVKRAEELEIPLRNEKVIYKLVDLLKEDLNIRLPQVEQQEVIGKANVLQEFLIRARNKKVPVAGCRCASGNLMKKHLFRLTRGDEVIHEGPIVSLKHFKNEVDSIKTDTECGIMMEDSEVRFRSGDVILCYRTYYVDDEIDWDMGF